MTFWDRKKDDGTIVNLTEAHQQYEYASSRQSVTVLQLSNKSLWYFVKDFQSFKLVHILNWQILECLASICNFPVSASVLRL